jgi:ATP synthase protein I
MSESNLQGAADRAAAYDRRGGLDDEGAEEVPFKRWSREEVQALQAREPTLSPWRVIALQAIAGIVCAALFWAFSQHAAAAVSALYGTAAVVVPGALLARGLTRRRAGGPGTAVAGFLFWEMVKIGAAVAMLAAAPKVVQGLSWPALLVAMIVCMKMNWLALLWRRRVPTQTTQRV